MINQLYSLQFLGSVCKMPVGEDGSFAKKSMVAKKNRYKDKFPCTVQMLVASCKLLVDMNCCSLTKAWPSLVNFYYLHLVATVYYYYILVEVKVSAKKHRLCAKN